MAPIRRGDGTVLNPKGFGEVRKGDGTVLWSPVDDIPDSGLDHFYWSKELDSPDPWPDEEGGLDASAVGNPALESDGINGNLSMSYDGIDDYHQTNSAASIGSGDEWTAVAVIDSNDATATQRLVWNGTTSNGFRISLRGPNGDWEIAHPGVAAVSGGSVDTDPHVVVATYDGSTAIMDVDGSEVINESIASPSSPSNQLTIAANPDGEDTVNGLMGSAGVEASFADSQRRDELTDLLADPFDITTST